MKIPPLEQNPLSTAWPAWVVQAEEALTLAHLPLPCPKETEPRAEEELKNRREEKVKGKEDKEEEEGEEKEEKEKEEEEQEKEQVQQKGEQKEKEELKEEEAGEEEGEDEEEEDNDWWLLEETEGQDDKERGSSSSLVQAATSMTLVAKSTMVSITLPYEPQVGNQYPHDTSVEVTALVSSREFSCGLSSPSSHSLAQVVPAHWCSGEDALGYLTGASVSCSSLREAFPKKELELNSLPGSTDSQTQASAPGSPTKPVSALKRPCKRKAATPELQLPPSGLLPLPWDQGDLPPPPKIPRIDTEKESDTTKSMKDQGIQIAGDTVDDLQPKNQVVSVHTAPHPVLPSPPPASGPAGYLSLPTDGVSSPGPPASTPLLYQAAESPIPSVPSPSLTPNIPTIPISPSALPSNPLHPCRARPSVETPPDAKKGPANLATALASISHLPRPGPEPLSFSTSSCRMESPAPVSIPCHPSLSFSATSLDPSLRNPHTVFSTTPSHACEDMSWEPSSGSAVMDMDTTPPSEAAILSSPTVSSGSSLPFVPSHSSMQQRWLAANATVPTGPLALRAPCHTPIGNNLYPPRPTNGWKQEVSPSGDPGVWIQPGLVPAVPPIVAITPSHPASDFELMDTTPPSKAVILHSSPAADRVSNSLHPQSVWGPTKAYNRTGRTSPSTSALLSRPQPDGCVFMRNPSTSTAAIGLTSRACKPARGSTTRLGLAGSTSPAHRGRPKGTALAYGKRPCASYIATPTSGFTLNKGMGSGDCSSSSTNFAPSTSALVRPSVPLSGENCRPGKLKQGCMSTPRSYTARRKGKDSKTTVAPIVLKLCRSSTHSRGAVQVGAGGH
ncbi:nuclear pore-associated protein 1 [Cricetulus griseus]|uniref:Nuclear pore-associated protein 1 n=1 Tax=Cricetulus griseus TaxID=10029 RepID=A0A061IAN3_CRIGR|nr:nuclear pore-associated protein 1 [Cricetulus griseus]